MATHRNVNKLVTVKKLSDFTHQINKILKADVESNNRGILALSSDGKLNITTWENKKLSTKTVEDVSDACWQQGGESEVIIVCHNGMLVRYSLHFDTGLSCSLQLSAASLLALIREKDSSVRALRSPKIFGYTSEHILLQLQSDRLTVLATNGGGRPTVLSVVRTPPLRTAYLYQNTMLVQPVTGCELHEYNTTTCKLMEIVGLGLQRASSEFMEWGSLTCSSSGNFISLVDSERHLYVTNFCNRVLLHKRGGVNRSKVTLHQIIWPSSFQPSRISQISLALSDSLLSVFCHIAEGDEDTYHYLSFDVKSCSLSCHHVFNEATVIASGLRHQLPDLFVTHDGVAMLMDEDVSVSSIDSDVDLGDMLTALDESLKEQNIAKVTEVKAMVEQGLSIFLSSCNRQEGWVSLAEMRAQQYGKLSDLLLSYIPDYAQSSSSYSLALALKHLAQHHFMNVQEEMANVLQYVDNDSVSQMVLQMKEQVSFYLRSVEQLQLPAEGADHKALSEQYLEWGDKPMKQILDDALSKKCVEAAESYLKLKPWVYGTVTTDVIISTCIDIAREQASSGSQTGVLANMDDAYVDKLKNILYSSDDAFEVEALGSALQRKGALTRVEDMAVKLVLVIHKTNQDLLTLPPNMWTDLIRHGDASADTVVGPVTVGQVARWTPLALMLVMTDLYVCTSDSDILKNVDADVMWQYLLYQRDVKNLKRWIFKEFGDDECHFLDEQEDTSHFAERIWSDPTYRVPRTGIGESSADDLRKTRTKNVGVNLLMGPQYGSDLDSSPGSHDKISLHSLSAGDGDTWSVQSFDVCNRTDFVWSAELFKPVTQGMIDLVAVGGTPFAEMMLNILAHFGVFMTREQKNAQQLMRRLLVSGAFEKVGNMSGTHPIQVSQEEIHKTFLEFFGKHDLLTPAYDYIKKFAISEENRINMEELDLPSWTKMVSGFLKLGEMQSKEVVYDLSLRNLLLLVESCETVDEIELPAFLTMLFAPTKSLEDFLNYEETKSVAQVNEISALCAILSKFNTSPRQVVEKVADKYPYLKKMFSKTENSTTADVTVYDLLNENIPYDMSRLFTWQSANRHGYDSSVEMPSFSDKELMRNYGLYHSLDYLYYLRDARPSYACAALITSLGVNEKKMDDVKSTVYGLALTCWPDRGVCSACVALLYMTNLDAEPLRVILSAAYMMLQARSERCSKMKLEKRQAQEHLATTEIKNLLEQLCSTETRTSASAVLLRMLEDSTIANAKCIASNAQGSFVNREEVNGSEEMDDFPDSGDAFPQIISKEHTLAYIEGMRICVDLSRVYKLPYPVRLLQSLAESNQWFLFIILAQVFKCPRIESLKIAESFQSMALKEHMMFALAHIHYYREGGVHREGSRPSSRNLRSSLYSRIGIQARGDSASPTPGSGDEKQRSSSPSECEFSLIDDALSITSTETCFDVGLDAWLSCGLTDLYSILLTCHQRENPAGELATAAVALQAPVLSVLAACYSKENSLIYLVIWLYTQLNQVTKKKLHPYIIKSEAYQTLINDSTKPENSSAKNGCCRACDTYVLQSGLEELKTFIISHISEGSVDVPIEGLKIFFPASPLLPLLQALQEANTMCRQETVTNLLSQCALAMSQGSQEKFDVISKNNEWFADVVVDVIGTALDNYVTNSHTQCKFLCQLCAVGQQPPFCCHNINWNLISELCKTLGVVKCQIKFRDLLWSFETGELKNITDNIISCLTNGKHFAEALRVSQLVSLPFHDILCARIKAEFERDRLAIAESFSNFNEFLKKIHNDLCRELVLSDQAVACFVFISKQLERHDMQYHCLQYAVLWTYKKADGSSSSSATTPELHVSKFLETSEQKSEIFEVEMWQAYVKAYSTLTSSDNVVSQISISPLSHLGYWPWEGPDGISPLNRSIILKSSGLNVKNLELARDLSGESEKEGDNKSVSDVHNKSPISSEEGDAFLVQSSKTSTTMSDSMNKEGEQQIGEDSKSDEDLDDKNSVPVSKLVDLCLDKGMIITACRILRFFKKSHKDVDTLLQMLGTADGTEQERVRSSSNDSFKVMPQQLSSRMKRTRSRHISVCSSLSVLSLDPEDDIGIKTPVLLRKSSGVRHGRKTAERIIMLYRVAASLDLSYLYVIHHPTPITLLSLVLRLKGGGVIQLARDLIHALPIPQNAITSFLCEEAVATITAGPGNPGTVQTDRLLLWDELETQWRDLITLCEDPSKVGNQLLDVGQRIGSSYPDQVAKVHSMSVELVIRAHDCFTASSNMEGISTVLRTSFYLTTSLLQHSQWSLMVRLLTGVGRYGEMSYIIDALREHDQFEPLLGRGSEAKGHDTGLDRALVHYLRSKYPEDTDTLILVALHFFLYSEVAGMWAADAEKALSQALEATVDVGESCSSAVFSPPGKTPSKDTPSKNTPRKFSLTRGSSTPSNIDRQSSVVDEDVSPLYLHRADSNLLTQAMHSYAHAAQYYMRDQQLTAAVTNSRLAELVALQIARVQSSTNDTTLRLLKLSPAGVRCVTTKYLNVCEALLVGRAYDVNIDWSAALYHQFVVNGDEAYLTEYLDNFYLSPEILLDVVKKLEHGGVTKARQERIATLLAHIEEADVVYRVASQLGLKGTIENCLASSSAAYLKDTVFKKGFTYNT